MHEPSEFPKTRRDDHLAAARAALKKWREDTWFKDFATQPFGFEAILPDTTLTTIASKTRLTTDDLADESLGWIWADDYGKEVLALMRTVDEQRKQDQAEKNEAKKRKTAETNMAKAEAARKARAREAEQQRITREVQLSAKAFERLLNNQNCAGGSASPGTPRRKARRGQRRVSTAQVRHHYAVDTAESHNCTGYSIPFSSKFSQHQHTCSSYGCTTTASIDLRDPSGCCSVIFHLKLAPGACQLL